MEEIPNKTNFLAAVKAIEESAEIVRDSNGKIVQINIPWNIYEKLLEEMEDIEDWITAFNYEQSGNKKPIPWQEVIQENP